MKYLTIVLALIGALLLSACGTTNNTTQNQTAIIESPEPTASEIISDHATAVPTDIIAASPSAEPSPSNTPTVTEGKKSEPVNTPSIAPSKDLGKSDNKPSETSEVKSTRKPTASSSQAPEKTGKSGGSVTATEKPVKTEHIVEIINFGYSPAKLEIKVGDTVKFVNRDEIRHSATADDQSFNSELLGKDESKTIPFDKQGEFNYFCMPHPGMKGAIIVKAD